MRARVVSSLYLFLRAYTITFEHCFPSIAVHFIILCAPVRATNTHTQPRAIRIAFCYFIFDSVYTYILYINIVLVGALFLFYSVSGAPLSNTHVYFMKLTDPNVSTHGLLLNWFVRVYYSLLNETHSYENRTLTISSWSTYY